MFLAAIAAAAVALFNATGSATTTFAVAPRGLGTIESVGKELFTTALLPFELSSALLLVAVVGAVAVARGKQPDPTLYAEGDTKASAKAGFVSPKNGGSA